ncbi:MAG: TAXI family TRAP transporter solute-binding subunit [Crocinitomicaceae bacterium]
MFHKLSILPFLILISAVTFSQSSEGKLYVFTIGISDYSNTNGFGDLPNATLDTDSIENVLHQKYGAEIYGPLRNQNATRKNIFARLNQLSKDIRENDKLLIWYSGHGEYVPSKNKGYWITSNVSSSTELSDAISYSDILGLLEDIHAKHILLISDACYSGALFSTLRGGNSSNFTLTQRMHKQSRYALTSGGLTTVFDGEKKGTHSPFAKGLLELLNSNDQMYLSSEQIGSYLENVVPINSIQVKNKEEKEEFQIPQKGRLKGDFGGVFTLYLPGGEMDLTDHETIDSNTRSTVVTTPLSTVGSIDFFTGNTAGAYFSIANDIATVSKGFPIQIISSGGGVDNLHRLSTSTQKSSFGLAQSDVFDDFKQKYPNLSSVLPLYTEEVHLIALKNNPIESISELNGKIIGVPTQASGTEYTLKRFSNLLGIKPTVMVNNFDKLFYDLKTGRIEAIFYVGGAPIPKFIEFDNAASDFIKLVPVQDSLLDDSYKRSSIPGNSYDWLSNDIATYGILTLLVTNETCENEQCITIEIVRNIVDSYENSLSMFGHPKWGEFDLIDFKNSIYTLPYIKEHYRDE